MPTYKVKRLYMHSAQYPTRTVPGMTGLTLGEAQAHCRSKEASSTTATFKAAKRRTAERGAWFDGYDEE